MIGLNWKQWILTCSDYNRLRLNIHWIKHHQNLFEQSNNNTLHQSNMKWKYIILIKTIVFQNAIHWTYMYLHELTHWFDIHFTSCTVYPHTLYLYTCSLFNRLRMASAVKSSRHFPRNVPSRSTFHSGEFSVYLFLLVLVK